jgi:hypothetical protein
MKKTTCALLTAFLIVGLISILGVSATAEAAEETAVVRIGDQDFTLVNRTGVEIYAVYVSPNNEDDWGEDVLGRDTLANGESVEIEFSPKEKAKFWDIRVEDKDGGYIEWDRFNLLEISKITLFYKNGKATATVN